MKCTVCHNPMVPLFMSWACDYCEDAAKQTGPLTVDQVIHALKSGQVIECLTCDCEEGVLRDVGRKFAFHGGFVHAYHAPDITALWIQSGLKETDIEEMIKVEWNGHTWKINHEVPKP